MPGLLGCSEAVVVGASGPLAWGDSLQVSFQKRPNVGWHCLWLSLRSALPDHLLNQTLARALPVALHTPRVPTPPPSAPCRLWVS